MVLTPPKFFMPSLLIIAAFFALSGCSSLGPMGSSNFDKSFSKTIEPEELLEHFALCYVYEGTFMEGESFTVPVHKGVLVMTDHRIIFTKWSEEQKRYEPLIWILYGDIKRVKKQNDSLLRFVAIEGPEKSKNAYHMTGDDVERVYKKIRGL